MKRKIMALMCIFVILFALPLPAYAADKDSVDAKIAAIPENWPTAPTVEVGSAILIDADSGGILYAKDATKSMYPASTTKLMTALLTVENLPLEKIVTFTSSAVLTLPQGSSHMGMRVGEQLSVRDCLYGLLLPSANEVANALAETVSGSQSAFVSYMNERASSLGAVNTNFSNPSGLHDPDHHTCAYDLSLMMRQCIKSTTFLEIDSTPSYVRHADALLDKDIPMTTTHLMMRKSSEYYNADVKGGKTGHTPEGGYSLVTYASKDGVNLICVVMGCEDPNQYKATQSLLDYGFNYFQQLLPAQLDHSLEVNHPFTSSGLNVPVVSFPLLELDSTASILIPSNLSFSDLTKEAVSTDTTTDITYYYENYPVGTISLTKFVNTIPEFYSDVENISELPKVENLISINLWVIGIIIVLILIIVAVIAICLGPSMLRKHSHRKMKL